MRANIQSYLHKLLKPISHPPSSLLHLHTTTSTSPHHTQFNPNPPWKSQNKDEPTNHSQRDNKFNEAIDVLCQQKRLKQAIETLDLVRSPPAAATYSALINLCLHLRALKEAKGVHAHMKSSGFVPGVFILNRLLDLYCKCESLVDAQQLFDETCNRDLCSWNIMISGYAKAGRVKEARSLFDGMPERDNFSWTAMVSGYVRHDQPDEALELFRVMQRYEGTKCNKFTVSSALSASTAIQALGIGKEIHCHVTRIGLDSDAVVWSSLCDMYAKCGNIDEARYIFDKTVDRDIVSWTAMIHRYFEDGRREEGFALFSDFLKSGMRPNEFTFAGVLNACAVETSEDLGKQVHGYMTRIGFNPFSFAASSLVHMYSKCGDIDNAKKVFDLMPHPDLVSWTSLINGYSQHGQPNEALQLFELLLKSGTKPDHITFVGVLSACTHAGLVDKGLEYFHSIECKHGLKHSTDHYACVIDLLSRSGRFKEAEDMIDQMPMKPDKFLWASLLGGCRIHGNLALAKRAAEALFELEPENAATYVTLANISATTGKWGEVAKIRKTMDDKEVVKKPGLSWIEIKRKVHVFVVGDLSHPRSKEINDFLGDLSKRMKEEGYVPQTENVLHDVEEEQKEQNLSYHSEKLAVAFGIIATPPGTAIKVFKNLRTCVDCHMAIKFISKIVGRKIIVRDSNRFHCFEDGRCSCKDYW
ncbi:pentatricopeptide repeat-containing protein At4g37170-like [Rhododendron vialii]|uniref:pentatricopeptide repeat-containing protein At4g37170-like n=1 Tax=Rhododendron vialii TaxID=182163 RepID=UPI00265FE674|nr:pentatricopeptide repeat-containing protein At4g37170-like [Rhododendron vialii]XP_058190732.1 pentatricopeptide repeat-containing protein At4g37170-like [Rhododendron vialii]